MLEGRLVELRAVEAGDLDLLHRWWNDSDYFGEYEPFAEPVSREALGKLLEPQGSHPRGHYMIHARSRGPVGDVNHRGGNLETPIEIGYAILPQERGKGYATEAVQILVDYLFLVRDLPRIQATTLVENKASQRVLEKAGFQREGVMRRSTFVRGRWGDDYLYAIVRDDWVSPRVLRGGASGDVGGVPARP